MFILESRVGLKFFFTNPLIEQVVEFQAWCTKLERFLHKNQHTQRKLLNFENWCSGEVSKSTKLIKDAWYNQYELSLSGNQLVFIALKMVISQQCPEKDWALISWYTWEGQGSSNGVCLLSITCYIYYCTLYKNLTFKVKFLNQVIWIFLIFFSLKNTNLGAHLSSLLPSLTVPSIIQSLYYWNCAQKLTACHYTNSQNSIISFGYVDS